jgi:hypothetical protein
MKAKDKAVQKQTAVEVETDKNAELVDKVLAKLGSGISDVVKGVIEQVKGGISRCAVIAAQMHSLGLGVTTSGERKQARKVYECYRLAYKTVASEECGITGEDDSDEVKALFKKSMATIAATIGAVQDAKASPYAWLKNKRSSNGKVKIEVDGAAESVTTELDKALRALAAILKFKNSDEFADAIIERANNLRQFKL